MSRGPKPTTLTPLTTRYLLPLLLALLVSACGGSRQEPTPTPLPPTQAELAAMNTPTPATQTTSAASTTDQTAEQASETQALSESTEENTEEGMTTASGLQYIETLAGTGPKPQVGEVVTVHYTGRLDNGTIFDSSHNYGEPIRFPLGVGFVIPGWDEGIALMSKGGKATLVIPSDLAYGPQGYGEVIPPDATLTFEVELVDITPGSPDAPTEVDEAQYTTTAQGLKYVDLVVGDGPAVTNGQLVVVHYTGWLADGSKFDSSLDRGDPITFNVGMGQVIAGWDLGVRGMTVGSTRQLVIPPTLGYGEQGAGNGIIPPNATLIFEIELLEVQ